MAAISEDYKTAFYELMDLPNATGWMTTDSMGVTVYDTNLASALASSTQARVNDYMDNTLTASQQATLTAHLDQYIATRYFVGVQEAGNVGSLSGMSFDFTAFRNNLRKMIQKTVPVFKIMEVEARKMGLTDGQESSTIRIYR